MRDEAAALLRQRAQAGALAGEDRVQAARDLAEVGQHDEAAAMLRQFAQDKGLSSEERLLAVEGLEKLGFEAEAALLRGLINAEDDEH